jgi:hypothetical protein
MTFSCRADRPLLMIGTLMLIVTANSNLVAQSPQNDIKGWNGAEWGMTIEQVRTATGFAFSDPPTSVKEDPAEKCYHEVAVQVGEWKAGVNFCLDGKGFRGLWLSSWSLVRRLDMRKCATI